MLTPCLTTPGDLAILTGAYRCHIGDQSARSFGMGTVTGPRLGRLNRSADMLVLLS